MDVDRTPNQSAKDENEVSGSEGPYSNIPLGLLKCTICDMTMSDGPVSLYRSLCHFKPQSLLCFFNWVLLVMQKSLDSRYGLQFNCVSVF